MDFSAQLGAYFWLPKRIEAGLLAHCKHEGLTCGQLFTRQLRRLTSDPQYQRRILAMASVGPGWPDNVVDCLLVAVFRAQRYREQAEALLLQLSPQELGTVEQEAIRRGLEYDELVGDWIKKRLRWSDREERRKSHGQENGPVAGDHLPTGP